MWVRQTAGSTLGSTLLTEWAGFRSTCLFRAWSQVTGTLTAPRPSGIKGVLEEHSLQWGNPATRVRPQTHSRKISHPHSWKIILKSSSRQPGEQVTKRRTSKEPPQTQNHTDTVLFSNSHWNEAGKPCLRNGQGEKVTRGWLSATQAESIKAAEQRTM